LLGAAGLAAPRVPRLKEAARIAPEAVDAGGAHMLGLYFVAAVLAAESSIRRITSSSTFTSVFCSSLAR
jgi:hypothetical protein